MADNTITAEAIQRLQTDYFLQFILDNKSVLEDLHHRLKGETLVEEEKEINGQKVLVPVYKNVWKLKPLINNDGLNIIMYTLNGTLTPSNATGNIEKEKAATLTQDLWQDIYVILFLSREEFEIESEAHMVLISKLIRNAVYLHLSKSIDSGFMKQTTTTYSYNEIRDNNQKKDVKETNMTI
jgi:hypothetical protein